jgi:hypothetical protein
MTIDQALDDLETATRLLGPSTPTGPIQHAIEQVRALGVPWDLTWAHVADVRQDAKRLSLWGKAPALSGQLDMIASHWSQALLHRRARRAGGTKCSK